MGLTIQMKRKWQTTSIVVTIIVKTIRSGWLVHTHMGMKYTNLLMNHFWHSNQTLRNDLPMSYQMDWKSNAIDNTKNQCFEMN